MAHVQRKFATNVYVPRACPMSATPAALPTDSGEPPTPLVSVTSSRWPVDISGAICSTPNMTGTLSITAENRPIMAISTP